MTKKTKSKALIESWDDAFELGWKIEPTKTDELGQQVFQARRGAHDFSGSKPDLLERLNAVEEHEAEHGGRQAAAASARVQEEITRRVKLVRKLLAQWSEAMVAYYDLREEFLAADGEERQHLSRVMSRQLDRATPAIKRATEIGTTLTEFPKAERDANEGLVKLIEVAKKAFANIS